jgi:2-iminobutanoate/2-iminopropanoate deaminase
MGDIVSLTHYATDIAAFMACGEIRGRVLAPPYPVTMTVEVSVLYRPDLLIEITAVAKIPQNRFVPPSEAQAMHR